MCWFLTHDLLSDTSGPDVELPITLLAVSLQPDRDFPLHRLAPAILEAMQVLNKSEFVTSPVKLGGSYVKWDSLERWGAMDSRYLFSYTSRRIYGMWPEYGISFNRVCSRKSSNVSDEEEGIRRAILLSLVEMGADPPPPLCSLRQVHCVTQFDPLMLTCGGYCVQVLQATEPPRR